MLRFNADRTNGVIVALCLDTLPLMAAAQTLYLAAGFRRIPARLPLTGAQHRLPWQGAAMIRSLPALLLLAGCAAAPPACDGAAPMTQLTAYLGGDVVERDWQDFLATSVTPAFPDGLTATEARGQWRDPEGRILREASRTLTILAGPDARARFAPVEATYRARFAQRSVLVTTQTVCARF